MKPVNQIINGWFSEICPMGPGLALSLEVETVLYSQSSAFQQIDVLQTRNYGKVLVLDGMIQLTEFDEFAYQEMMAHLPLFSHPDPKQVLVIGGGDGGVLREVCRHKTVEAVDFCEIDEQVIEVAKAYLPTLSTGFDDPRVTVHIRDGARFAQDRPGRYDVIIVDSSDPIGPAAKLFTPPFYACLKNALRPGGVTACQGESIFLHPDLVRGMTRDFRSLFPVSAYAWLVVPTYPGGHIGICLGSRGPELTRPARDIPSDLQHLLRYYTPQMHRAAFVLPRFARKIIEGAPCENG